MGSIFSPKAPETPQADASLTAQLAEKQKQIDDQNKQLAATEETRRRQLLGKRALMTGGYAGFDTKDTLG